MKKGKLRLLFAENHGKLEDNSLKFVYSDYSVFAERDVTTSSSKMGTLVRKYDTSDASGSGPEIRDDEEGNV